MLDEDDEARCTREDAINQKVSQILNLVPLKYRYPEGFTTEEFTPAPGEVFESSMRICVSEFMDDLAPESDIEEALSRIAIEGPCEFRWWAGHWPRGTENEVRQTMNSPTWGGLFKLANRAFLEEGSPDHCFLESIHRDERSGVYGFFFGS